MTRRLMLALVALLLVLTGVVIASPDASANPIIMWQVQYGSGYTSNPPNVWSNRSPTWDTGSNPHLRFQTDANLVDYGSFCPGGVCWATGTNGSSTPAHLVWQGDGNVVIYDSGGHVRCHL